MDGPRSEINRNPPQKNPASPAALEVRNRAVHLARLDAFFQVESFVSRVFAFSESELHLDATFFPIESQCDNRPSGPFDLTDQSVNFCAVNENPAGALGVVLFVAGAFVGLDARLVEEEFATFDPGERPLERGEAGSEGFDFGALQFESCLKPFEDMVVPESLAVGRDFRGHCSGKSPPRGDR